MDEIKQTVFKCDYCGKLLVTKVAHGCSEQPLSFTEYELHEKEQPKMFIGGRYFTDISSPSYSFNHIGVAQDMIADLLGIKKQPKFKVGEWVRIPKNNCYKVVGGGYVEDIDGKTYLVLDWDIYEKYMPKENEFYYCESTTTSKKYIACSSGDGKDFYSLDMYGKIIKDALYRIDFFTNFRPLTKEQKYQLIQAVEKEHNQTWNGSKWVDMCKDGDVVIAWDNDSNSHAIIGILLGMANEGDDIFFTVGDYDYDNIAKFKSMEQYHELIKL